MFYKTTVVLHKVGTFFIKIIYDSFLIMGIIKSICIIKKEKTIGGGEKLATHNRQHLVIDLIM